MVAKKTAKRFLALLLCLVLSMSALTPAVLADSSASGDDGLVVPQWTDAPDLDSVDNVIEFEGGEWVLSEPESVQLSDSESLYAPDDIVTVIVVLEEEPLLVTAAECGLSGDMPAYLNSAAGAGRSRELADSHELVRSQIRELMAGSGAEINAALSAEADGPCYDYTAVLNGFSMKMPYGMIGEAEALPGVKRVTPVEYYSVPEDQESYDLQMTNSTVMIGSDVVNDMSFAGADGSGAVVAILDTGLDTDHEAFSVMPGTVAYTQSDVQKLIDSTESGLSSGVTDAAATYVSAKVPYAYDYANGDADVNGDIDHGVHVAGTVAGNNGEDFFGVAPNAQLMIMKVFSDGEGSTSDDIIYAGLDDAVKLGADSINMSLGSAAGFSWSRETEDEVFNNCWDAGINLLIAAGNETSAAYGGRYGNSLALADSVDNGIVGSPSTSYSAISVASMQNTASLTDYFLLGDVTSEEKIGFSQMVNASSYATGNFYSGIRDWTNNYVTYEYVVVPGIGAEEDYEGLDVSGKLALVQRGQTNFEDKLAIAVSHGAKAVIIYNNISGAIAPAYNTWRGYMIGIALEDGEKLLEAAVDGVGTVTFGPASSSDYNWNTPSDVERTAWKAVLPAYDAGQMSSFSSAGPAPDLSMKPEISAPGGNIISSVIGGGYGIMSGTSMATPHMAGVAALVRGYVRSELGITDSAQLRDVTECLMMSTAVPGTNEYGAEFSPRQQGAGLVDVEQAVTSAGYLSVNGKDGVQRPKAELGWNDSGTYAFSFTVHNLTDEAVTYILSATSLTEGILTQYGVDFSDGVTQRLEEDDFTATFCGDAEGNQVTVPANGTADVTVSLVLSGDYQRELFANFPNGNYVEGYVYLQPADGVTLVLPYLGFFGDWTDGVVFEGDPETNYLLQPTLFATANVMGSGYYLGENAYNDEDPYNYDRLAFSPTIAGAQQYLATVLSVRRNVTDFQMSVTNSDGEEMWSMGTDYLRKTYYYPNYGYTTVQVLSGWTGRYLNEETGEYTGDFAPTGEYYNFNISGNVAQCEEGRTTVTYPIWLDAGAPTVDNIQCFVDTDGVFKLAFDVQDDHYVRLVELIDSTATWLLTYTTEDFAEVEPQGSKTKVIMDLDGLCQFLADNGLNPGRIKLSVSDYALNHTEVYVDLGPQFMSMSNMTIAVGDSQQAELRVLPARLADTLSLTWTSGDETIATVDENGLVTGVSKGETTISATADTGLTATARVTIGDVTLPPVAPETPNPDARVDKPSAETLPAIWDTRVPASDTDKLGQTFEDEESGFWYKVTGADTVQLIANPNVANSWSATYPNAPAELVIPETVSDGETEYTVTTIGANAFYLCNQITSVTMPDTIRVIGDKAFQLSWYNSAVTSIDLPEGLEEVGDYAFAYCANADIRLPSTLRYIGSYAFSFTGITQATFGDALEAIGTRAFSNCTKLTQAELPVAAQYTEGIYLNSSALAEVEIEDGVTVIPENAFFGCKALSSVEFPDSVLELRKSAFYSTGLTDLCLEGTNITTLGDFAYAGLDNCYDFVIPDTVTYVGSRVFYWCRYVRSVSFGENVAYVGDAVMSSFFIHPDVEAVIPDVGSATAGAAVRRSGYLGQITKDGVPFEVYTGAPFTIDGISYMPISDDEVMVTGYDQNTVYGVVNIPETVTCEGDETTYTVTAVGDRLFSSKYNITEVHLPDTITTVGERAFDQIHALEYINIPTGLTTLTGIQAFGYGGWDNLEWSGVWNPDTLVVPGSLETWNQCAFSGNHYTSVVLSEGLKMVGEYGLSGNKNLTDVQIAGTVEYLKNNAFSDCTALTSIELPEGLRYIGANAFMSDPLESVTLPDSLEYIGSQAFEAYEYDYSTYPPITTYVGVQEITLGGGIKGMGWNAFVPEVNVTTVLGSTRNLVVERNNLNNVPTVCWDGKTDIPAGDYSVIPEGVTVVVTTDVRVDGSLIVEGTLDVEAPGFVICTGEISGDGTIIHPERIGESKPIWPSDDPVLPTDPNQPTISGEDELPFVDVNTGDWFYDNVKYVWANDLMKGTDSTHFLPNATLTRGMLVTVLYRMENEPAVSTEGSFTDVTSGAWYGAAVEWAAANGIVKGYDNGKFGPNDNITREQMAAILYRYAQYKGCDVSVGEDTNILSFTDAESISAYAVPAMQWACGAGLINGADGMLMPASGATRAQAAAILNRYCENVK